MSLRRLAASEGPQTRKGFSSRLGQDDVVVAAAEEEAEEKAEEGLALASGFSRDCEAGNRRAEQAAAASLERLRDLAASHRNQLVAARRHHSHCQSALDSDPAQESHHPR